MQIHVCELGIGMDAAFTIKKLIALILLGQLVPKFAQ